MLITKRTTTKRDKKKKLNNNEKCVSNRMMEHTLRPTHINNVCCNTFILTLNSSREE